MDALYKLDDDSGESDFARITRAGAFVAYRAWTRGRGEYGAAAGESGRE
jgi:hypothetical protein